MTDRTAAERMRRLRARERAAGLVRMTVTIPEYRAEELAALVEVWRREAARAAEAAE